MAPEAPTTIPALLAWRAETTPHALAHGWRDEQGRAHRRSWMEVARLVDAAAGGLRARGVRRGDRVAIVAPPSEGWEIAQLAILAAGGVVVGVEPRAGAERVAFVLRHAGARVVVAGDDALAAQVPASAGARLVITLDGVTARAARLVVARGDGASGPVASDPATVVYTSGT